MSKTVILSVVVPVYNTEKYIRECVDSIVAQNIFSDMELILVDDGSTDSSPVICDDYSERYENISVIHQKNAGVSAARNAGIAAAKGEYIGFVDSDDYIYNDMYSRLYSAAKEHDADMSFCGLDFNRMGKIIKVEYPFSTGEPIDREQIVKDICPFMLRDSSFNTMCTKIFRTQIIRDNFLMLSTGKKQGEDRQFVLNFLRVCKRICCVDFKGYFYRSVESSATQKPRTDFMDELWEQFSVDLEQFSFLGFSEKKVREMKAPLVCSQVVGAACLIAEKMSGAARTDSLKALCSHEKMNEFIRESLSETIEKLSDFDSKILSCIVDKNLDGIIRAVKWMKFRVRLSEIKNKF